MGEAFVFVFLIFALSRLSFTTDHGRLNLGGYAAMLSCALPVF